MGAEALEYDRVIRASASSLSIEARQNDQNSVPAVDWVMIEASPIHNFLFKAAQSNAADLALTG